MKTFLFRSLIGIFFGAFIAVMTTMSVVYFGGTEWFNGELFIKNAFGTMFCGWFFTVSPLYFEISSLRLPQQTALHFATVIILNFILSLGVGWITFDLENILCFTAIFIGIYAVIWICFYLYYKNEAKKLNDGLQNIDKNT
ncbi:DUF3021 domain-containing protein [Bacillus sp. B190/17]|uniref:DUF3021 domain-containing protein n=1 Tax=Bacillus lumedeiriae TaxID=3058829 RepID=A0ABW8I9K7_9BACI